MSDRETIYLTLDRFTAHLPERPGNYAVRKQEAAKGFSNEQVVRVFKGPSGVLLCLGPGWTRAEPVDALPLLWGPRIEIDLSASTEDLRKDRGMAVAQGSMQRVKLNESIGKTVAGTARGWESRQVVVTFTDGTYAVLEYTRRHSRSYIDDADELDAECFDIAALGELGLEGLPG